MYHNIKIKITDTSTYNLRTDATKPSARGLAHVKQNHSLPNDRQMPQNHWPEVLHMSNRITYFLMTGRCHKSFSQRFYTYQTESLTC
jgi:hypothetical protein